MLSKLLVILMIPTFLLYTTPIPQNTRTSPPADLYIPIDPYDESDLTFDQLLSLIETAENPETISRLSPADLDKLSHLMTTLAKEGILPGQENLEDEIDADIDSMQSIDQQFVFMTKHPLDSKQYTIDYSQDYELIRCGWFSKKWKKTCKFARKHKKAIIIGAAAVVVVTAIVITAGVASGAAAATAATAASQVPETSDAKSSAPSPQPSTAATDIEKITADYKQQLAKTNPQLISSSPISEPTIENIRDYSSVITHQMVNDNDAFSRLNHISYTPTHPSPLKIDQSFGTDLAFDMLLPPPDIHPDAIPHYIVGQKALEYSNYSQALKAFDKTIALDPTKPTPYLNRGFTRALLGQTNDAEDDFQKYKDKAPIFRESDIIFTYHFAKGLPKGVACSCKQLVEFAGNAIVHPVYTSQQVYTAFTHLSQLVYTQQWKKIGATLAPEAKLLIEEWNSLPVEIQGDRAGRILSQYGSDLLLPAFATKATIKGVKAGKNLSIAYRNLKNAEKLLVLETGVGIEGAKLAETFQTFEKVAIQSEKLGFSSSDLSQILNAKKVEACSQFRYTLNNGKTIGFTNHALRRALERNITKQAIFEAIEAPLEVRPVKIDKLGRPSQRFIGQDAEVVLNTKTQQIVSVNPTSRKKAKKLQNGACDVSN